MTDTGQSIGIELIQEIARQDMIQVTPRFDRAGNHIGHTFHWAANADEQLEGHLYHVLRGRGLAIARIKDLGPKEDRWGA